MVLGRAGIVTNVAILSQDSHLIVADIVLRQTTGGLKNFKVAVAAWDSQAQPDWTKITSLAVRFLAGEFQTDVIEVLKRMRESCKVNVAAWKPGRIGHHAWSMSTSVIFAIGPVAAKWVLWDSPCHWENIQESTDTTTMVPMGAFPPSAWHTLRMTLFGRLHLPTPQLDVSHVGKWARIPMVKQMEAQQVDIPHAEKLFISVGWTGW